MKGQGMGRLRAAGARLALLELEGLLRGQIVLLQHLALRLEERVRVRQRHRQPDPVQAPGASVCAAMPTAVRAALLPCMAAFLPHLQLCTPKHAGRCSEPSAGSCQP